MVLSGFLLEHMVSNTNIRIISQELCLPGCSTLMCQLSILDQLFKRFHLITFFCFFVTPGKFMAFLCNCLVKLAQNGGDESDISVETDSQGLSTPS